MRARLLVALLALWACGATAAPPPPLELADLGGRTHRLADYRGKVVLVNFWATWCGPCREEMPSLERLRRALEGRPFVVLAVNVAEGGRIAGDYLKTLPHGFTVLLDRDGGTTKAWGARILPATYVLGPDGDVRIRHVGAIDWSSTEAVQKINALMQ
jgi:thiol-disulfide isomerase/thioredoxin